VAGRDHRTLVSGWAHEHRGFAVNTPNVDWFALSPSLALLGGSGVALLGAVLVPRAWRKFLAAAAAAAGFITAAVFAILVFEDTADATLIIGDTMWRDRFSTLAALIVCGAGLLTVLVSWSERTSEEHHVGEFYALLAAAGAGMVFFVAAGNLMTLFLALEWFSICLYVLCAIDYDNVSGLEAGLKYLIVGSVGSAVLLFGCAFVYGATGELEFTRIAEGSRALGDDPLLLAGLAMIITGLGFKASAAPFHQWTPDVYEGAPTPVTAFMSAATKTVALVVALRLLVTAFPDYTEYWTVAAAVLACASLAIGNFAALVQRNVKRLLAYSSVSHAGFMLIAIAANNALGARALLFYLIPYGAMSVGAFAVVAARERELGVPVTLDNLAGFGWERPLLGFALWWFVLGFAGLPLTGGFVGKFYVFSAAYESGWWWLIIVGIAATAVSLAYYLGVVRALYLRSPLELRTAPAGGSPPREGLVHITVLICLGIAVASFIAVQPLIDVAKDAAESLPF
jgi:NADH-quinone oxidoreductase subunit N